MKPQWKRYTIIAVVALATSLLIWRVWQRREAEREAQKQRVFDELKHKVTDFAEGRGAVIDWQKGLGDGGSIGTIYTADLQPRLVRADGRPIFFYGQVLDIETGSDGYVVWFKCKPRILAEIHFSLACRADVAAELLKHRFELFSQYAVVAQIEDVRADQSHPREEGGEMFVATGRCLEIMPTGVDGYGLSLLWGLAK